MKEPVLCWGGDSRMKILAEGLRVKGWISQWIHGNELPECKEKSWYVFPVPTLDEKGYLTGSGGRIGQKEILSVLPSKSHVAAYLPAEIAEEWQKQRPDLKLYLMNEDEMFLRDNGRISAEGAMILACSKGKCLFSLHCLVLGYGQIGRALCRMLKGIGTEVIAVGRRGGSIEQAIKDEIEIRDFETWYEVLSQADLVINTIPWPVMGKKELTLLRSECRLMELASAPYGIDKDSALELGLEYALEASIPGRMYPRSAAEAMLDSLCRIMQKEEGKDES